MKWVDRLIGSVAPKYAIRRMQVRQQINNFYEAAQFNRLHARKFNSSNPDAVTKPAIESLRDSARHFEQNYDIGRGVLNVLVANTIGDGIKPIAMVKDKSGELDKEFNDALKGLWNDWIQNPEVTGDFDYYSAQRMLARSLFRDGEVLQQYLEGTIKSLDHQSIVPFSIELIESDYLPNDYEDEAKGIVQGVQKNGWGRAKAFFIYKNNPDSSSITSTRDVKRISADQIDHLKLVDRIRQTRGVSIFASVLNRFDDIKDIDESERVAAKIASSMAGFIRKGSPDMYIPPTGGADDREMMFSSGMIFDDLNVGEEIGTIDTTRPNNELIPFRDSQLRGAAAGTQASYSSISKNYDGTYSSQRQELVEQYASYGLIWAYLKERAVRPTWKRFVKMAVASRAVDTSNIDLTTLYDSEYTRPPLTWIDPKKEMDAIEKEIAIGITSRTDVIRRRGGDFEETVKKIAEEQRLFEELGIVLGDPVPEPDPAETVTDGSDDTVDGKVVNAMDIQVGEVVQTDDGIYLQKTEDGYALVAPE